MQLFKLDIYMKIYFAGSISGGRHDAALYLEIIELLKNYGVVLTEHVGDQGLESMGEDGRVDHYIHDRDMDWLLQSDVIVAEVTTPSLGVGYEIGRAIENGIETICLYRPQENKRLSAMIAGSDGVKLIEYESVDDLKTEFIRLFVDLVNR